MITDNVLIEESLHKVIEYAWRDEMKNFEENFEVEISSQDDLNFWIKWCEENEATDHIFFHLMVIAKYLQ